MIKVEKSENLFLCALTVNIYLVRINKEEIRYLLMRNLKNSFLNNLIFPHLQYMLYYIPYIYITGIYISNSTIIISIANRYSNIDSKGN
jgi:hypothetical protein